MHPPIDVTVRSSWSNSVDSDAALYSTESGDAGPVIGSVGSISSECANADSFLELEESKKQTKFLEELLNYSESASMDSQSNGPSDGQENNDSGSVQSDWAHADSASINDRANTNSLVSGMMGLLLACTYPVNQTNDVVTERRTPDVSNKVALVAGTNEGDLLDKVFNGFENTVCHDEQDVLDHRENQIIDNRRRTVVKQKGDILDNVFESMESLVCREGLHGAHASNHNIYRDYQNEPQPRALAGMSQVIGGAAPSEEADILDNVFQSVESVMCRDGPRDPPANRLMPEMPHQDYVVPNQYMQSHRGDWRVKPGDYSFDRDNSIIVQGGQTSYQSPEQEQDTLVVKRNTHSHFGSPQQNKRDMLDFVFDGVEEMVCNDEDDLYLGNRQSQFDEDLPLKRFHWEDE